MASQIVRVESRTYLSQRHGAHESTGLPYSRYPQVVDYK